MRELKTTLRNGFRQGREPPLHYLNCQIRGRFPTSINQLFYQNLQWSSETISKIQGGIRKAYE